MKISSVSSSGKAVSLAGMPAGMWFGEGSMLKGERRQYDLVTLRESRLAMMNRTTFAWTASTVISAQTQNPDLAYEALVELTEGIHHWKIVAPRKSLATAEVISTSEPRKAANAQAIADAVQYMRSYTNLPRQQEWDSIFWGDFMDPLIHHQGTAADLAAQVKPSMEDVLP